MSTRRPACVSPTIHTIRQCGAFAISVLLLIAAGNTWGLANDDEDDGWRRTKDGWEHISTWPPAARPVALAEPVNDDLLTKPTKYSPVASHCERLHPALLAIGICLAASFSLHIPRASSPS
jgi:hypothetical protein